MTYHADAVQHHRRTDVAFALLIMLGIVALTMLALWVQSLAHELRVSNAARDALARQVQALGAKPIAGPPGSRGEPGESIVGPTGATGPPGSTGPIGPTGRPGPQGDTGKPGASATGSPGTNGVQGPAGPSGPQGVSGVAGPHGERGPTGPQGEQGAQGPAGPSCPDGYSLQAPSYDPDALVCRKDGTPDPDEGNEPQAAAALDPSRRVYA